MTFMNVRFAERSLFGARRAEQRIIDLGVSFVSLLSFGFFVVLY